MFLSDEQEIYDIDERAKKLCEESQPSFDEDLKQCKNARLQLVQKMLEIQSCGFLGEGDKLPILIQKLVKSNMQIRCFHS